MGVKTSIGVSRYLSIIIQFSGYERSHALRRRHRGNKIIKEINQSHPTLSNQLVASYWGKVTASKTHTFRVLRGDAYGGVSMLCSPTLSSLFSHTYV